MSCFCDRLCDTCNVVFVHSFLICIINGDYNIINKMHSYKISLQIKKLESLNAKNLKTYMKCFKKST